MQAEPELLDRFAELDDFDVLTSVKVWKHHSDKVLSRLSAHACGSRPAEDKGSGCSAIGRKLTELRERVASGMGYYF
jgi:hypothetical protein